MNIFTEFKNWLFDYNLNSPYNTDFNKAINPVTVLGMFANHYDLTIYLNTYYNRYEVFSINREDFFKMLKELIIDYNINKNNTTFMPMMVKSKSKYPSLHKKFPHLKDYEVDTLATYEHIKPFLKNETPKIKKLTKKKKVKGKNGTTKRKK